MMTKITFRTLKTERDFTQFRNTKPFHSPLFRLHFVLRPNQNSPRFGFIVPKKIFPKVVIRNLLKRRLKRIIQLSLPRLKPADILLAPKSEVVRKKYAELESQLTELFTNAHLWQKF
ncbi:MAG: ribonuclease P protein component [Candidatus Doudnabacteria bacterium]|nr:ribonuclease P protein component [Candidatus Doudnabacteria bacterium]